MRPGRFLLNRNSEYREKFNPVLRVVCLAGLVLGGCQFFACGSHKEGRDAAPGVSEEQIIAEGVEILRNGTPVERDSVTRSFYNIRNSSLLIERLSDPDTNVRIGVVSALGYIRDKAAARPLNEMLLSEQNYILLETIISSLQEIRDTSSVTPLVGLFENETTNRDLRLSLPITLAAFAGTPAATRIEDAFVKALEQPGEDIEICSFVAMGIHEIVSPQNYERFRKYIPTLRKMADKRKKEVGEDLLWSNFEMAVEKLETYEPPAS